MVKRETDRERDQRMGGWDRAQRFCDEHADDYDVLHVEPRVRPARMRAGSFVLVWFVTELHDLTSPGVDELLDRVDVMLAEDGRTLIRSLADKAVGDEW